MAFEDAATTQNKVLNTHKFDKLVDRHSSYTDNFASLYPEQSYLRDVEFNINTKTTVTNLEDVDYSALERFAEQYGLVIKASPFDTRRAFMYLKEDRETYFYVSVDNGYTTLSIKCTGNSSYVNLFTSYIEEYVAEGLFQKTKSKINWMINKDTTIQAVVTCKPDIKAAYPWLGMSVKEYSDLFFKSDSSILLLLGAPGSGKSSFLKSMCLQSEKNIAVTYDKNMIETGQVYGDFFDSSDDILIIEDADTLLKKREDGNDFMATLLNMGDGLVSTPNKKIIFTTNLPTIKDIDPALIRPGRCFDILNFRKLNYEEALDVLEETGKTKELSRDKTYSLAELLNEEPRYFSGKKQASVKPSGFGFGS